MLMQFFGRWKRRFQHKSFQSRVRPWLVACFGEDFDADDQERDARFMEEALELFQARGRSFDDVIMLAKYVYSRPVGEVKQELGGVMTTLAALSLANGFDMHEAGDVELARIWTKVDAIREKQIRKPKGTPLPGSSTLAPEPANDWQPSPDKLHSACFSYRHDYGLLGPSEQAKVRFQATQWLEAWLRELPRSPTLRNISAPITFGSDTT